MRKGVLVILILLWSAIGQATDCRDQDEALKEMSKMIKAQYKEEFERIGEICKIYPYGTGDNRYCGYFYLRQSQKVIYAEVGICDRRSKWIVDYGHERGWVEKFLDSNFICDTAKVLSGQDVCQIQLMYCASTCLDCLVIVSPFWRIFLGDGEEYFLYNSIPGWQFRAASKLRAEIFHEWKKMFLDRGKSED